MNIQIIPFRILLATELKSGMEQDLHRHQSINLDLQSQKSAFEIALGIDLHHYFPSLKSRSEIESVSNYPIAWCLKSPPSFFKSTEKGEILLSDEDFCWICPLGDELLEVRDFLISYQIKHLY